MTDLFPLNLKLYIDDELEASYTSIVDGRANCVSFVMMGHGPHPWRLEFHSAGEMIDGWYSFRSRIVAADGTQATDLLPFLIYDKPAQYPSVLVAPCRWPYKLDPPWVTQLPPRVFVVTAQHPDFIGAWDHDAGETRTETA